MRTVHEIQQVADRLGQVDPVNAGIVPALDWRSDKFRYGFLMGKLVALGWVLEEPSVDMSAHYDFEDWLRERREAGDELRERFGGDQPA